MKKEVIYMEDRFTPQGAETFTARPTQTIDVQQNTDQQPKIIAEQVIFDAAFMRQTNKAMAEESRKWEMA